MNRKTLMLIVGQEGKKYIKVKIPCWHVCGKLYVHKTIIKNNKKKFVETKENNWTVSHENGFKIVSLGKERSIIGFIKRVQKHLCHLDWNKPSKFWKSLKPPHKYSIARDKFLGEK